MLNDNKIIIHIEDGIISDVDGEWPDNLRIIVRDHDIEGIDENNIIEKDGERYFEYEL